MQFLDTTVLKRAASLGVSAEEYLIRSRNRIINKGSSVNSTKLSQALMEGRANQSISLLSTLQIKSGRMETSLRKQQQTMCSKMQDSFINNPSSKLKKKKHKYMLPKLNVKTFIYSKRVVKIMHKCREIAVEAAKYFELELTGKSQNISRFRFLASQIIDMLGIMREQDEQPQLKRLMEINIMIRKYIDLPNITSKILYVVGVLLSNYFKIRTAIRTYLDAELVARQCKNYPLVILIVRELIQAYTKLEDAEQARLKCLNLLYLAVKTKDEENQSYSLTQLSICYYYLGDLRRSRMYSQFAEAGLSSNDIKLLLVNFSNQSRVAQLQLYLGYPSDIDIKYIIQQHQPFIQQYKGNSKAIHGNNTSKIFKTHKSPNRNWENYLYFLSKKKHLAQLEDFFVPSQQKYRHRASQLLGQLEQFLTVLIQLCQLDNKNAVDNSSILANTNLMQFFYDSITAHIQ